MATPQSAAEGRHDEILERLLAYAEEAYEAKEDEIGADQMRMLERILMLRTIDGLWVEHLTAVDEMRQGIGLRAYGQTDPLVAYKREAHDMWGQLLANIRRQIAHSVYHVELTASDRKASAVPAGAPREKLPVAASTNVAGEPASAASASGGRKARKIGRNEKCPCGSGKKYKKCHGLAA